MLSASRILEAALVLRGFVVGSIGCLFDRHPRGGLEFLEVREDLDGGGFGEGLVLQVEAFQGVGGCGSDWF
jgi:hypothetical protein